MPDGVARRLDEIDRQYRDGEESAPRANTLQNGGNGSTAPPPERSPLASSFAEIDRAQREREEIWKESVRKYALRVQADRRDAWIAYHYAMIEKHRSMLEGLIARHRAAIVRLEGD